MTTEELESVLENYTAVCVKLIKHNHFWRNILGFKYLVTMTVMTLQLLWFYLPSKIPKYGAVLCTLAGAFTQVVLAYSGDIASRSVFGPFKRLNELAIKERRIETKLKVTKFSKLQN